jgi:2-polyprenyl-3-methyl-5-hydroxy-6-metoxy-1,4-benzoquinol methylase
MQIGRESVKQICFYLPQFHRIPENDRWWGEGFTEWTLVQRAQPLFHGHRQPRAPHEEWGYYNLLDPLVRKRQGETARAHGIYGFCYYHYWFNGKKLLERPVEQMLEDGYPDLPFCLCWANEPWSRRWDGSPHEILQPQEYGGPADWAAHFDYLRRYFLHPNYIKVDGKPVFLIYRIGLLGDANDMLGAWRQQARVHGWPGMHFLSVLGWVPDTRILVQELDGVCEFYPNYLGAFDWQFFHVGRLRVQTVEEAWRRILQVPKIHPVQYRGAFACWDDTPRLGDRGLVYLDAEPQKWREFLSRQMGRTLADRALPEKFLFINAWNEWGEGCYLEPDRDRGMALLEAVRDAQVRTGETTAMAPLSSAGRDGGPAQDPRFCEQGQDSAEADRPSNRLPHRTRHGQNPLQVPKVEHYYRLVRGDVISVLLQQGVQAKRVLELGCGSGDTGRQIKQVLAADWYVGIDKQADAARDARANLDLVHVADMEQTSAGQLGLAEQEFDLLVALDVLEHLYDPWDVLAELAQLLKPGGHAILSVPNTQNIALLADLVQGQWRYTREGLLDATHVRFFTWQGIEQLLAGAGLALVHMTMVLLPTIEAKDLKERGNVVNWGKLRIADLSKQEVLQLFSYQYITLAKRGGPSLS